MKSLDGAQDDELRNYEPNAVFRRQDLPPLYQLDGGIIALTRESLFEVDADDPHAFLGQDRRAIRTEVGEVVDIDEPTDLLVAEVTLQQQLARAKNGQAAAG
jgi:CMP-N-acetylneuraminic acid synthetase